MNAKRLTMIFDAYTRTPFRCFGFCCLIVLVMIVTLLPLRFASPLVLLIAYLPFFILFCAVAFRMVSFFEKK